MAREGEEDSGVRGKRLEIEVLGKLSQVSYRLQDGVRRKVGEER